MKIKNKGFTLIELMITVVIVSILAAVALPAYQDYTIRSQVTEGLSLVSGTKVAVSEYYSNHGEYPATMADIGMASSAGSFIEQTSLGAEGQIIATFGTESNTKIVGGTVSLIPYETNKGNLEWSCESNIVENYLPTSCINKGSTEPEQEIEPEPYSFSFYNPHNTNPYEINLNTMQSIVDSYNNYMDQGNYRYSTWQAWQLAATVDMYLSLGGDPNYLPKNMPTLEDLYTDPRFDTPDVSDMRRQWRNNICAGTANRGASNAIDGLKNYIYYNPTLPECSIYQ